MKKKLLLIFALLLVMSCSKPNVKKETKIVEKKAAPVVEKPKIVEKKATPVVEKPKIVKQKEKPVVQAKNEIPQNLKDKWEQRIKKQNQKEELQKKNKRKTEIAEQGVEPLIEEETEIAQANEDGAYKDGKRDGVWTFTDEKGIKEKEVVYNEDGQEL